MNKERRKELAKAIAQLEEIRDTIEYVRDEEQEAYDNMPESLQDTDRGQAMLEAIDNLDYATGNIDDAIDNLSEIE